MSEQMIDAVLRREGSYVNNPADRGGPTNYGITQKTLKDWRGHPVTAEDVRALPKDEARTIYRTQYYRGPKIDTLPARIQSQLFDMAVNLGQKQAIRLLQQVLIAEGYGPLSVDGIIGAKTWAASETAAQTMGGRLNNALVEARITFYQGIVVRNRSQEIFLKGWLRRAEEFREEV